MATLFDNVLENILCIASQEILIYVRNEGVSGLVGEGGVGRCMGCWWLFSSIFGTFESE